jgi:hypothetical protein
VTPEMATTPRRMHDHDASHVCSAEVSLGSRSPGRRDACTAYTTCKRSEGGGKRKEEEEERR